MMNYQELASTAGLGLACFVLSAVLVRKLKRYLEPRQQGEGMADFLARARNDQRADKAAFVHMFGEGKPTPHRINFVLMLCWFWCMAKVPAIAVPSMLYVLVGMWITRDLANAAKRSEFDRLGYSGRAWFRLFYAWSWPLSLIQKSPPKAD